MATQRHFQMEEEVLFPAFEAATGMTGGPTQVMRGEHDQMRALLEQLAEGVSAQDATRVLGLTESFMVFIQQHNMKEEQILYPMTDQRLADAAEVMEKLRAFLA